MEKIMKRLQEMYDEVENMGHEVVGVFLQGSQNYGLDYEGSDIDSKAIIIPKFNDFVLSCSPVSTTHVCANNEHIDLKDIRLMFECFKKQNINFVEILFTKYAIINPKYQELFQPMIDNREKIARYNNYAAVACMVGMILEKNKALEHPYPATLDKIEKFGYDPKQLHHIYRVHRFLLDYMGGTKYSTCLYHPHEGFRKRLLEIKLGSISLEDAREEAQKIVESALKLKTMYYKDFPQHTDREVETVMKDVLINIIRYSFIEQLKEQ